MKELPTLAEKMGYKALAAQLSAGEPTIRDIIAELQKPGRDPRESLPPTVLRSDVLEMKDLKPEMELTGTVRMWWILVPLWISGCMRMAWYTSARSVKNM